MLGIIAILLVLLLLNPGTVLDDSEFYFSYIIIL